MINNTDDCKDIEALDDADRELLLQALRVIRRDKFRLFLRGVIEVCNCSGYGSVAAILNNGRVRTIQVLKSVE
jgi:hypothetical protein